MGSKQLRAMDLEHFSSIGDLAISPIGTRVAYTRQYIDVKSNSHKSDIWLAISYTGFNKRLTVSGCRDSSPAWSPDGLQLAFISDRSGKRQIYLIDPDGGEAQVIATGEEPSGLPIWSPDGKSIAFVASVRMEQVEPFYPGAPDACELLEPDAPSGSDRRPAAAGKEPIVIKTLHHKLDGRGFFGDTFSHVFVVDAKPTAPGETAKARQVTSGRYNHEKPEWSPDGRQMLCIANREQPDDDPFWDRQLWLVDLETGAMTRALSENYRVVEASWSSTGRLAFIGCNKALTRLSEVNHLFVMDFHPVAAPYSWTDATNLSACLDRSVGIAAPSETRINQGKSVFFSSGGHHIYFLVSSEGETHVWRVSAGGGQPEKVSPDSKRVVACPTLSSNGWLAYTAATPTEPDEVYTLSPKGVERKITVVNEAAAKQFSLAVAERFEYKSLSDFDIEGWYMKPAGATSAPYPTVMTVHGGPHGMFGYGFSFLHQLIASNGYAVLYVNPRASSGYKAEFHDAVEDDWGGGDFQDLMKGLDELVKRGIADNLRLGITGWSFGGYMTCWAIGQTRRFRAAVAGACISNQHDRYGTSDIGPEDVETSVKRATPWTKPDVLLENSPIHYAGNVTTPLLLICGDADLRCPVSQTEQMYIALKRQGKDAIFVRYPGEYHGLRRPSNVIDRYARTVAWFRHYIK